MRYYLLLLLITFQVFAEEITDDIYWDTPYYLSKLEESAQKTQCVYHRITKDFKGTWIIPLNLMPFMEGYEEIYQNAIKKYDDRTWLLDRIIPTLNCLWNDVIFFSPLHPHKHYEEYVRLGYTPRNLKFFKIPVEVLKEKRVTVWKWLSEKKYPVNDPIHISIVAYCALNFDRYQEMEDLPDDTKEFYQQCMDPTHPDNYPRYNWFRIPHILCQDPIDTLDPRITIIDWEDPI